MNINTLRNKFEYLFEIVRGNVNILLISKTKLDKSFPTGQFKIDGFNGPFKLDQNINGSCMTLFVREDITKTANHRKLPV